MNARFIKSPEKRRIVKQLNEQFGIEKLPYLLLETGKEKIRFFSGNLSKEEIIKLSSVINIELIGIYAIRKERNFRLSIDAIHLLKSQISKNIFEITDSQLQDWIRGRDLYVEAPQGTLIIKNKQDFIGSGISTGLKILNHIPKDRRLKNKKDF